MLSPLCFIPYPVVLAVAVGAPHHTLVYFFRQSLHTRIPGHHQANSPGFVPEMVEFQNNRVSLPTIKTQMRLQIREDVVLFRRPEFLIAVFLDVLRRVNEVNHVR